MTKQEMLETLLETHKWAIETGEQEPLLTWLQRVNFALAGAGMEEEYKIWGNAIEGTRFYTNERGDFDPTLVLHVETMRGILQGFLAKLEQAQPNEELFPIEIVEGTRAYIYKIALQANGCYRNGWYDGSAVMIRRLLEIMIVDCFIKYNLESKIRDANDRYFGLEELIKLFLAETAWHVPPLTRKYLPQLRDLKDLGDSAVHGRDITPHTRIEKLKNPISYSFQALADIAYSK